jgi:hypothetical protein
MERSGGFTGIPLRGEFDTLKLPPGKGETLRGLVDAAGFFALPASIPARSGGADRFQYRLTVEEEGRSHTVQVGEGDASPELLDLIQELTILARSNC